MRVCFIACDNHRDSTYSTMWFRYPAAALPCEVWTFSQLERGEVPDYDVYVLEREAWRFPWQRLGGKRVLCWLDDAYYLMPKLSPNYGFWQDKLPVLQRALGHCSGVIAPNPYLAADYAEYTPETYFIPNYHNFPRIKREKPKKNLIGWGGSWQHWTSWRDTRAYELLPDGYRMEIIGHKMVAELVHNHYRYVEALGPIPLPQYLEEISTFSVYLIPLAGEYDKRRSWIKAVEAAYAGVPWLAFGDAANAVYRMCKGGVIAPALSEEAVRDAAAVPVNKLAVAMEWAESLRVVNHVDEWRKVILG